MDTNWMSSMSSCCFPCRQEQQLPDPRAGTPHQEHLRGSSATSQCGRAASLRRATAAGCWPRGWAESVPPPVRRLPTLSFVC